MDPTMQQPSRIKIFLAQIWPYVYRVINGVVYFLFHFIINGIKRAIDQIKGV